MDDPERLADGGRDLEPRPRRVGPGSRTSIPSSSARWLAVGSPPLGAALSEPRRRRRLPACPRAAPTPRLSRRWRSLPTSRPRCSSCSSAARATPTWQAARPGRGRGPRARARALTELGGADPDRNVGLTDYLLGQADPIGRADASRHLRDDPADHRACRRRSASALREMFPTPSCRGSPASPAPAVGAGDARARRRTTARRPRTSPPAGLSRSQTRLIVILGSAAVLPDRGRARGHRGVRRRRRRGDRGGRRRRPPRRAPPTSRSSTVPLRPVGGGNAHGRRGVRARDRRPALRRHLDQGLDPAPNDRTYVIWLMLTETEGYPLSPIPVDQNGTLPATGSRSPAVAADRRPGPVRRRLDRARRDDPQARQRRDSRDRPGARGARRGRPAGPDPKAAEQRRRGGRAGAGRRTRPAAACRGS